VRCFLFLLDRSAEQGRDDDRYPKIRRGVKAGQVKKVSSRRDFLKVAGSFAAGPVIAGVAVAAVQPAEIGYNRTAEIQTAKRVRNFSRGLEMKRSQSMIWLI